MPSDWHTVDVIEFVTRRVLQISDGYRAKNRELGGEGPPFARARNIGATFDFRSADRVPEDTLQRAQDKISQPGDVVFTSKGTVGRVAFVSEDTEAFVYSPQLCFWRSLDHEQVDPRFLFYWFQGTECTRQLVVRKGQTDMADYVSLRDQRTMRLTLPPIAEQRAIASVLAALGDKVASNRITSDMHEAVAASLRERIVRVGARPDGWQIVPLSAVVAINPRVQINRGCETPFIEMASVAPFATRPDRVGRRPFSGGSKFEPGDTLMARITGCIEHGKGAFVDFVNEPAAGSTEFIVMRAKPPLTPEAVFFLSRDRRVRAAAIASMTGTSGRQRVDSRCFDVIDLAIAPDSPGREAVFAQMAAALGASRGLWSESQTLMTVRDALLPKLVSGQIRVPPSNDPEEQVGAAVEALA